MAAEEVENNLPPEIMKFSGDWQPYEDVLYKIFIDSVVKGELVFFGLPVGVRYFEPTKGKHFTFWHLITEGKKESERLPDLRRCERISWIAWIIKNYKTNPDITFWESKRKKSTNFVLWYEKGEFAVVLSKRSTYFILTTAYQITEPHRIKTFKENRAKYRKRQCKS